ARIGSLWQGEALPALAAAVADGQLDPYAAAQRLLTGLDHAAVAARAGTGNPVAIADADAVADTASLADHDANADANAG
ncbi:MAG TPA: hypothetical protein VF163_09480, partial [Micromonosporaceae bacterium]